jgi:hypothetical protein
MAFDSKALKLKPVTLDYRRVNLSAKYEIIIIRFLSSLVKGSFR